MTLVNYLQAIPDPRRSQAKQYDLGSLLLFCIMAILSGATSYRKAQRFMHIHRKRLNQLCDLSWKKAPAHNTIRYALHLLEASNVEQAFRHHASQLQSESAAYGSIAMDGKVIRGSFDHFEDKKAAQVLSALATGSDLVLGHLWITDDDGKKEHEIQAVQSLVEALGLSGQLFTLDALHTQKNSGGCPRQP